MKLNRFYIISILVLSLSCKKSADEINEPEPEPEKPVIYSREFIKYKRQNSAQKTGLQMTYKDTIGNRNILFYGSFTQEGLPAELQFLQVVRPNNDTVYNYHLDDTLGVSYITVSIKNKPQPLLELLKVSRTPTGDTYLGLYHRKWVNGGDSLIEQHYIDKSGTVIFSGRVTNINAVAAADRNVYTEKGVDMPKMTALGRNVQLTAEKIRPILVGFVSNGTGGMLPVYAFLSAALDLNGVLSILAKYNLSLSATGPTIQFQISNDFPIAVITQSGGAFLANYQQIASSSVGGYIPPVLLLNSTINPENGNNFSVITRFTCPIENYYNGRFFHSINKDDQVSDTAIFFFTDKNNSSYFTKHRQTVRNVFISADNIVSGEIVIHNVWPLIGLLTMEEIYAQFKSVTFYTGFRYKNSGWGNLSNYIPLRNDPDGSEKFVRFDLRVDGNYACEYAKIMFIMGHHPSRRILVYYRRTGSPERWVAEIPPIDNTKIPAVPGEAFIGCEHNIVYKIESTRFMD